jgi:hypothetical protein
MACLLRMRTWTVGTMLAGAARAVLPEEVLGKAKALVVTIHVTDNVNISSSALVGAQASVTDAYSAAGFQVVWSSAPWQPEPDEGARLSTIDVRLVILPADMAERLCREEQLGERVLGIAASGAEAGGRVAYVFYHRIERVASAYHVPVVRALGHVVAHEVGHALIGVSGHSGWGLMAANWNPRRSRPQTFMPSQVEQIRRRFMHPARVNSAARPGLSP